MNNINIIHNTDNIELYVNLKYPCRIQLVYGIKLEEIQN